MLKPLAIAQAMLDPPFSITEALVEPPYPREEICKLAAALPESSAAPSGRALRAVLWSADDSSGSAYVTNGATVTWTKTGARLAARGNKLAIGRRPVLTNEVRELLQQNSLEWCQDLYFGSQGLPYLPIANGTYQVLDPLSNGCNSLWADRYAIEWEKLARPILEFLAAIGWNLETVAFDWEPKRHSEQIRVEGSWPLITADPRWPAMLDEAQAWGLSPSEIAALMKPGSPEQVRSRWGAFINSKLHGYLHPLIDLFQEIWPGVRLTCTQFRRRVPSLYPVWSDSRDQLVGCGEALDVSSCQVLDGSAKGYFDGEISVPGRTDFWSRFVRDAMLRQTVCAAETEVAFTIRPKPFSQPPTSGGWSREGWQYAANTAPDYWAETVRHCAVAMSGFPLSVSVDGDTSLEELNRSNGLLDSLLREANAVLPGTSGVYEVGDSVRYGEAFVASTRCLGRKCITRVTTSPDVQLSAAIVSATARALPGSRSVRAEGSTACGAWVEWRV